MQKSHLYYLLEQELSPIDKSVTPGVNTKQRHHAINIFVTAPVNTKDKLLIVSILTRSDYI